MLTKGSASLITLLVVLSLQELQLLAAPGIENAAYTSQDLLAEASDLANFEQGVAPAPLELRRLRRFGMEPDGGGHCGHRNHGGHHHGGHRRHSQHHRHGFGHDHEHGHGYGHGYGHGHGHQMHGQGPPPNYGPWHGPDFNSHNGPTRHTGEVPPYGNPFAPIKDKDVESGEDFNSQPTGTQSTIPTNPSNTTPWPSSTTPSTPEDSTYNIDIRLGS